MQTVDMGVFVGVSGRVRIRQWAKLGFLLTIMMAASGLLWNAPDAQTVTGQIAGEVVDPTGGVVAGAKVTLTYTLTQQARTVETGSSGDFVFPDLLPGSYNVTIAASGFQTYTQTSIVVAASERVALHAIQLQVGNLATEVTVTANQAHVETDSSEHGQLLTSTQYANVPDRGRNYLDYLQLLPGVTAPGAGQTDAPGWGSGAVSFNGGSQGEVVMQLDGVTSMDTGQSSATGYISPSVDAVQEVKVQVGNMDAEYGSRAGGTVNVIIKNGTNQFHGSAYEYNRNDDYNANTYFNKLNGVPRAPYKYNNFGGTFGGPVLLPGVQFNRRRDKLFFFFSADYLKRNDVATNPTSMTTPTPAERAGVFSGLTGNLVNPSGTAPVCSGASPDITCAFSPSDKSLAGDTFLNLLPQPTCRRTFDPTTGLDAPLASLAPCSSDNANYHAEISTPHPWYDDILRVDYNLSKNELMYVRLIKNYEQNNFPFLGGSFNWPQLINLYTIHSTGAVMNLVSNLRPNVVNELVVGTNRALQTVGVAPSVLVKNQRAPNGLGPSVLPVLFADPLNGNAQFPGVNPLDLIPDVSFGGPSLGPDANNAPNFQEDLSNRFPFFGTDTEYNITDNLTWIKGTHNLKFGIYFEKTSRNTQRASLFQGQLNFAVTSFNPVTNSYPNPLDTGSSLANAYVGVIQQYTESNIHPVGHSRFHQIEWFAQDNWKATRRLTIDYGVRFQFIVPDSLAGQTVATFVPQGQTPLPGGLGSAYNPALQPRLITPCSAPSGGCDPGSSATFPSAAVGLFVPGTGEPYQGMVQYRDSQVATPKIGIGPRFGFAYDIFGDGKTALRGGAGLFYDRPAPTDPTIFVFLEAPPLVQTSTIFNTTISRWLASPPPALQGPAGENGTVQHFNLPVSYQYSLGLQRDLGHGVLLDASYVGNQGRRVFEQRDLNMEPYGTHFLASSQGFGGQLPDIFLVPNKGYADPINYNLYDINSNYNSLQMTVEKRFGNTLTAGGAWTYAKSLQYAGSGVANGSLVPSYIGIPDHRFYGPTGQDLRHVLTINWTYNIPGHFQGTIAREALNGWSISGLFTAQSGPPGNVSFNPQFDITGSNAAPNRPNISGNAVLPAGQRTRATATSAPQYLRAAAFSVPNSSACATKASAANCGFGNAGPTQFYIPGVNNWDIGIYKAFPLGKNEARELQLQLQTFNTFNHTQFNAVDTNYNPDNTGAVGNPTFGQVNGAASPRIMVLGLKLKF